jgi:DNA-binding transcriptional LysR family regulator
MNLGWNDLRLFLNVARLGGLSAAARTTGVSPATLGRRVTALEHQIGKALFHRSQTGYTLTHDGEELLARAEDVEAAMLSLTRWQEGAGGTRTVRISAGSWTTHFLAQHIGSIWQAGEGLEVEFVTAAERVDIGRRNADIGIRNLRPTEQWLAGRMTGKVAFALYTGRELVNGVEAGLFVGLARDGVNTPSARWLAAHHGNRMGVRANDGLAVRELVAAGAGLSVLPCFIGDADTRLNRIAKIITELTSEQWLVTHHEQRHDPAIRKVADRIAQLLRDHGALFRGERPQVR